MRSCEFFNFISRLNFAIVKVFGVFWFVATSLRPFYIQRQGQYHHFVEGHEWGRRHDTPKQLFGRTNKLMATEKDCFHRQQGHSFEPAKRFWSSSHGFKRKYKSKSARRGGRSPRPCGKGRCEWYHLLVGTIEYPSQRDNWIQFDNWFRSLSLLPQGKSPMKQLWPPFRLYSQVPRRQPKILIASH